MRGEKKEKREKRRGKSDRYLQIIDKFCVLSPCDRDLPYFLSPFSPGSIFETHFRVVDSLPSAR